MIGVGAWRLWGTSSQTVVLWHGTFTHHSAVASVGKRRYQKATTAATTGLLA